MFRQETLNPWEQLPMYAVSDDLAPRIDALGIEGNLKELRENGYTVIQVDRGLTDRIRSAILRLVEGAAMPSATFDRACATPLGEDPVFEEACVHPAALALAEYICGRGCTLSSTLATAAGRVYHRSRTAAAQGRCVGLIGEQEFHRRYISVARGRHQRRAPVHGGDIGIGSLAEKQP